MAKIRKTPTELKQDALFRAYKKKMGIKHKKNKKKAKSKPTPYESDAELKKLSYPDFLKSKYWAKVRGLILKRDNFSCIICKSESELQVHHDHYKNHFNELNHLSDLMTLCKKCHTEHHYSQL